MANTQKYDLNKFIPLELKNELNTSLVSNLFNRFLSEEQSVFVSGQIGKTIDPNKAVIQGNDLDRELNALVPALYYKTGTEESIVTFNDLLNKMKALGVDVNNLNAVLAEQSLNFAPPIDLDKFINYSNYYWTKAASVSPLSWNSDLTPEYYVIKRPPKTSTIKLPVALATTGDIKLYGKDRAPEKITIEFSDADHFTISGDQGVIYLSYQGDVLPVDVAAGGTIPNIGTLTGTKTKFVAYAPDITDVHGNGYGLGDPNSGTADKLFSFSLIRGAVAFEPGDKFNIDITYMNAASIELSFTPGPTLISNGKGVIENIIPDSQMMFIDGVQVKVDDIVLVKNQINAAENGVYRVRSGHWVRASRYSDASCFPVNTMIYVLYGGQAGKTFQTTSVVTTLGVDPLTFTSVAGDPLPQANDWQIGNLWAHKDDLVTLGIKNATQATRPIIEYIDDLHLNQFTSNGFPSESGTAYVQRKTRTNQIPQFDLFYYDGTHSKKTSSIFFYEEDSKSPIDAVIQRRLKLTPNQDFVFGVGITDAANRLLFFKKGNNLSTIWAAGVSTPVSTTPILTAEAADAKGTAVISDINAHADNQTWTLTSVTPASFSIKGTRSGLIGTATVGIGFVSNEFNLMITAGSVPFVAGDYFTFSINNVAAPRYVKKDGSGNIVNFPGGPAADVDDIGTWLVPRRMFENMPRGLKTSIAYADMIDHFRSIIKSQNNFSGASLGSNNFRTLDHDLGLGGTIREYGSNFPLLASMLSQQGISPISILDFAEQQYLLALSSIDQFLINELASYISGSDAPLTASVNPSDSHITLLLAKFEELRANDQLLKDVFSDSTAGVKNWPITLPMIGLMSAVQPTVSFEFDLGIDVLVHHDGHVSPLAVKDSAFDRSLAISAVERSDGTKSPGTISETAPSSPFARQLWYKPSTNQLFVFDVVSDLLTAPATGSTGQFWYRRTVNELRAWDSVSSTWVLSTAQVSSRWTEMNTAAIRNSLVLAVETKLFEGIHPSTIQKFDLPALYASDDFSAIELAKFSAKHGYDTYAPIYDAADAFTWNYKASLGQSRWFDVYRSHFGSQAGMLSTARPNLEPWKLLGYSTKAAASTGLGFDWDTNYKSTTTDRLWKDQMWSDIIAARPGVKLCVNITNDALLPPYVSSSLPESSQALLSVIPSGVADTYQFLDNGPVENVWKKSLEYGYSLTRVLFKRQPLKFHMSLWGETYMFDTVPSHGNGICLERNLLQPISPSQFKLHGERLQNIVSRDPANHINGSVTSTVPATVLLTVAHVEDNQTFIDVIVNGTKVSTVTEGTAFTLSSNGVSFSGVMIDDLGLPFSLGDIFTINFTLDSNQTIERSWAFAPEKSKKLLGICQLYTNLLRYNYIDVEMSKAINAFRGWDVKLVHRLGALIRNDSLTINTSLGALPETAFDVILQKSENLNSKWISALRIQLVHAGKRIATSAGKYIPADDGSDWVFRIETYNPQNPTLEYYELNSNGSFNTFNALQKQSTDTVWKRYSDRTTLNVVTTPFVVTGIQRVLDVIFGYVDRLSELGFLVNASERTVVDAQTGRNLDWQLEVEKLIDHIYTNFGPGDGHILNPFAHALWVQTPTGLLSKYSDVHFVDVSASQSAFDVIGQAIPVSQLFVIRTDDAGVTYSDTPIFSAHLFNDEFEHIIVFNSHLNDEIGSPTIFDSLLGMRIDNAYLSFTRKATVDRKPTFDGFVISGNDVVRNITSSADSIASYYDSTKTFNEPLTAKHALSLLGFSSRDYFSNLGVNEATQFNFWRGLIQSKGTNTSLEVFVNYKDFSDANVDEYWAYKVAEYGDSRTKNNPEIKIGQLDCLQNFTQLQFYSRSDSDYQPMPLFTQIEASDDSRWFNIDDLGQGLKFTGQPISETVHALSHGYYRLSNIYVSGDSNNPTVTKNGVFTSDAEIISSSILKVNVPGAYIVAGYSWPDPSKYSPIKLFDYKTNTLVKQIGMWHPAIGIHASEPLEIVNIISTADPALYNYSTQTHDNPNFGRLKPWGKKEVGRVWWDTSNLGYIAYYDALIYPDRSERNSRWGNLAEWATVDLYEWTESDVPPNEYDDLAASQEGRTDIPLEIRASGKVANKQVYKRNRTITTSPIAWSKAGVGDGSAHPSFGPAFLTKTIVAGGAIFADAGRTADINLVDGRHFSAWTADNKPVGEVIITDQVVFDLGSFSTLGVTNVVGAEVKIIDGGRFGKRIGKINVASRFTSNGEVFLKMFDDFGNYQELPIVDWTGATNDVRELNYTNFGLKISASGSLSANVFAENIESGWVDVYVREGVRINPILDLPDSVFINDETDPEYSTHEYGWKTWEVPTQDDLDSDLMPPLNEWQPYIGDDIQLTANAALVKNMQQTTDLTLKSGITIKRYSSSWSNWIRVDEVKTRRISDSVNLVTFPRSSFIPYDEVINPQQLSLYINGIQLNPKTYKVEGEFGQETVKVVNILPEGTTVLLIYRAYQPTAEELSFDPAVKDDPSKLSQYKEDYQYTKIDVRNSEGIITSAKYFFWVKDKTIIHGDKSMSLVQAQKVLTNGPDQFMKLSRLRMGVFDSVTIRGLNTLVTDNDRYKLRFTVDYTLRDNPAQLNLKNVHTEWTLMRRSQTSKIPKTLWDKITDTVAGEDAGGIALPYKARVDYDERHGTRTSFGFQKGQILADKNLVANSIINTILNTALRINIGDQSVPDYITVLDLNKSNEWFATPSAARNTMDLIWASARPRQINEIFFEVLEDALANSYEFSDIFKTSLISIHSVTKISEQLEGELEDGQF